MIINCQECGDEMSDNALKCPHCGAGLSMSRGFSSFRRNLGIMGGVILVLIGIWGIMKFYVGDVGSYNANEILPAMDGPALQKYSEGISQMRIFIAVIFCLGVGMFFYFLKSKIRE